jgi:hypothetical protein
MPEFDKWWNDTKKHSKRVKYWLPHWRAVATRLDGVRPMRYFTLCARSMIDVFMLVKEGMLKLDPENYSIGSVQFCECDAEQYVETRDLIAREDAGFLGYLEDIVLFEDDDFTGQFPTLDSISAKLEDERLQDDYPKIDRLQLKRTHLNVKASFPYDYVNLDFCQYYYPQPPGMLRINRTVERFLDWQRRASEDGQVPQLDEFVLAVTCRHDADFPAQAEARLSELIKENCASSAVYKKAVEETRKVSDVSQWLKGDREDFFFAGWPKDIARAARDYNWKTEVLDYVYYERTGDQENPYKIACLVARFTRANPKPDYSEAALYALKNENRVLIPNIDRASAEGKHLIKSLGEIVAIRNEQARRKQRPELPAP